MAEVEVEME